MVEPDVELAPKLQAENKRRESVGLDEQDSSAGGRDPIKLCGEPSSNNEPSSNTRVPFTLDGDAERNLQNTPEESDVELVKKFAVAIQNSSYLKNIFDEAIREEQNGVSSVDEVAPLVNNESMTIDENAELDHNDDTLPRGRSIISRNKDVVAKVMAIDTTSQLAEDVYSFMIISRTYSSSWWIAYSVYFVENLIFALMTMNLANPHEYVDFNTLGVPVILSWQVSAAQFVAIFIAVITQDDLRAAVKIFFEGYDTESWESTFPHARYYKWIIAIVLQTLGGMFGISVTFLLVITSSEVIDLLLNFTAVEFVSLFDNTTFILAVQGFLGPKAKADTVVVQEGEFKVKRFQKFKVAGQVLTMTVVLFVIMGWWINVYIGQQGGRYAVPTIYAQFDDDTAADLAYYTGFYSVELNRKTINIDRILYRAENSDAYFAYCDDSSFWIFSKEAGGDPCDSPTMKSSNSDIADISELFDGQWFVATEEGSSYFNVMLDFYISVGCTSDSDCGDSGSVCSDAKCSCAENYLGPSCQFNMEGVCQTIGRKDGESIFEDSSEYDIFEYSMLLDEDDQIVQSYYRPVYYKNSTSDKGLDVLFYSGLRWIVLGTTLAFPDMVDHSSPQDLVRVFDDGSGTKFHAKDLNASNVKLRSEVIRYESAADKRTPFPTEIGWLTVGPDGAVSIDGELEEVCCGSNTDCGRTGNTCNVSTKQCTCYDGSDGSLCAKKPLSNGRCDLNFNDDLFDYDGGDCCPQTCTDTKYNTCGYSANGTNIGFPNCEDPFADVVNITVTIVFDDFAEEISLELFHVHGGEATTVGQWSSFASGLSVYSETISVPRGSYTLKIDDSYGDGMNFGFIAFLYGNERDNLDQLLFFFNAATYGSFSSVEESFDYFERDLLNLSSCGSFAIRHYSSGMSIRDVSSCNTSDFVILDESGGQYSLEAGEENYASGYIQSASCDMMYLTYFPSSENFFFVDSSIYDIGYWLVVNSTGPSGVDGNFVAIRSVESWKLMAVDDGSLVLQDGDERSLTEEQLWSIDGVDLDNCARRL